MTRKKSESAKTVQEQGSFDQSEARFRAMFDTSAVGIGMMSLDRKLMDANPALCKMFEMPREELIGQMPVAVTYPEDYEASTKQFQELLSGKVDSFLGERRYQRKNGEVFWAHVTMSLVRDADGKPLYIIGMLVDIDERKRAMLELHESVERFRATFDSSVIGMGLLGLDGKILRVNDAVCKMSGYTEEELTQRYDYENVYPGDREIGRVEFEELVGGKRQSFEMERRYIRKNGEVFWTRLSFAPVRDAQGNVQYLVGLIADIDEEKHALAELQESEARFRGMFESSAMGVVILDTETLTMRINPAARAILDDPNLERTLESVYEIVHEKYQEAERGLVQELIDGKRDFYEAEHRYQRPDREPSWVQATFSAVRDADGKLCHIVVMLKDITEQKKAQESSRESEARFRAMFEDSGIGIALVGMDRRALMANDALVHMSGYSREELLRVNGTDISYPADRNVGLLELQELLEGKRNSYTVERRYVHKNSQPFWIRQTVSAVRQPDGKPIYLAMMVEDINHQKRDQELLLEVEARFRAMFDHVSVGMAMVGLDRRVLALNPATEKITGYQAEELVGTSPVDLSYPEDRLIGLEQFRELVAGQRDSFQMEKRYVRKNGEVFWARITYAAVFGPDGKPQYLVGSIEDVNEQRLSAERLAAQEAEYRRTLEQRVEERTRELHEANLRLVGEIEQRQRAEETLATKAVEEAIIAERTRLARDLHDAVTQTLFSASLIAEVLPDLWQVDADEARKSNEELRQLTRGALAEMRTLLLELRPTALTQARFPDLLKQLSEAVIGRARLPVELVVEGTYELPPDVKVAFYRITQESLNNIVKYARATQVEIKLRLECCNVHMEIKDNGAGFDPATVKPTSLGMRIMRERADAVHARLNISSTPGQGTTVGVDWNEDELIRIPSITIRGKS